VANIRKTDKGSSGGSGSAATAPGASASAASGTQQSLFVQGIQPDQLFTGDSVRSLAEKLLAFQGDGGKVVLA
jgi:hypothetical protein